MIELQTILGTDIPIETRAILYICNIGSHSVDVVDEILFNNTIQGLHAYCEIPNPASQLVTGNNFDELITEMHLLHDKMKNNDWIHELRETI